MALIDQAKNYIGQLWGPDQNDDPMWELVVKQDNIRGVDVFFYAPRGLFELQGEARSPYLVAGNAPIIYDRESESFIDTGTAAPIETYIEAYLRFGDPHLVPGPTVTLLSYERGAQKIKAIKVIRKHTECDLAEAKACVDGVLEGKQITIVTMSPVVAVELAAELSQFGFIAKQDPASGYI